MVTYKEIKESMKPILLNNKYKKPANIAMIEMVNLTVKTTEIKSMRVKVTRSIQV